MEYLPPRIGLAHYACRPPQIKFLHPNANISTTHHERPGYENATKGDCAWVASTDPLFGQVADAWMKTMIADFGTDHW